MGEMARIHGRHEEYSGEPWHTLNGVEPAEIEKIDTKIKELEQQHQPGPKDFTAEDKYIV